MPPTDFLRRTVPALVADSGLAYVQARWGHANRTKNWLTRAQGMLLDAHFAVEQEGRFRAGLPMSFNGTAGVWSRAAIDNGGGWTGDTLTEDLDLSMRCAMKGWRAALLLRSSKCPANCRRPRPPGGAAGALDQGSCAKRAQASAADLGERHAAVEEGGDVAADMPVRLLHAGAFTSAVISLTLMSMGVVYIQSVAMLGLSVSAFGLTASLGYLYLGQVILGREGAPCLARALLLGIVFPSGLILSNSRATFEAFFGGDMVFTRTLRAGERYVGGWRGGPELIAGVLLPIFAFAEQAWSAPFFFFAVAGLVSIGAMGFSGSVPAPVRDVLRQE